MCECNRRVWPELSLDHPTWRSLARALITTCENTEQSSRNLRENLILSQAWRLHRMMIAQRGREIFPVPPLTARDVPEWCRGLLGHAPAEHG